MKITKNEYYVVVKDSDKEIYYVKFELTDDNKFEFSYNILPVEKHDSYDEAKNIKDVFELALKANKFIKKDSALFIGEVKEVFIEHRKLVTTIETRKLY